MKFSCIRQYFLNALHAAEHATRKNTALPILQNVLLKAEKGKVFISATDLEIGIRASLQAKVTEEGECTFPARILSEFLTYTNEEKINLSTKGKSFIVQTGSHHATIQSADAKEFPIIPNIEAVYSLRIPGNIFLETLSTLAPLGAVGEVRPELGGVFCAFEKNQLRMAATDSFRLGEYVIDIAPQTNAYHCIIPVKSITEIVRVLDTGDAEIEIFGSAHQILLRAQDREILSRLIEGKYPEYQAVIPASCATRVYFKKNEALQVLRAAGVFSGKGNEIQINVSPEEKRCIITSHQNDTGAYEVVVPCEGEGKALTLLCNYRYLIEALEGFSDETISIEANKENDPLLIQGTSTSGVRYVVVPLRSFS